MASEKTRVMVPGRLLNESLFTKDVYKDEKGREGKPEYKCEVAFDPESDEAGALWEAIYDAAIAEWGDEAEQMIEDGQIEVPVKDGDEIADKREAKGKPADAYRGLSVIRPHTEFNLDREDADGGIYVVDEAAEQIAPGSAERRKKVYRGSYGIVCVTPSAFVIGSRRGVTLYLDGWQFTHDGDRLGGGSPAAGLFKAVEAPKSAGKGRAPRGGPKK